MAPRDTRITLERVRIAVALIGASIASLLVTLSVAVMLRTLLAYGDARWSPALVRHEFARAALWHCLAFWLVVAIMSASRDRIAAERAAERSIRLEQLWAAARLRALQQELDPHFLFNTLNSIAATVEQDPADARRMIADLGELLRQALDAHDTPFSALGDELRFVQRYITMQKVRYGDRLMLEVQCPPDLLEARFPSLLLQPLIENAVQHGIAQRQCGGQVRVNVRRHDGRLIIGIENPVPSAPRRSTPAYSGRGLKLTRERLHALYGAAHADAELRLSGEFAVVIVTLPYTNRTSTDEA